MWREDDEENEVLVRLCLLLRELFVHLVRNAPSCIEVSSVLWSNFPHNKKRLLKGDIYAESDEELSVLFPSIFVLKELSKSRQNEL